jgi:hypothetical protein
LRDKEASHSQEEGVLSLLPAVSFGLEVALLGGYLLFPRLFLSGQADTWHPPEQPQLHAKPAAGLAAALNCLYNFRPAKKTQRPIIAPTARESHMIFTLRRIS